MRCQAGKGHKDMNYRVIDKENYYRSGVFHHFTEYGYKVGKISMKEQKVLFEKVVETGNR